MVRDVCGSVKPPGALGPDMRALLVLAVAAALAGCFGGEETTPPTTTTPVATSPEPTPTTPVETTPEPTPTTPTTPTPEEPLPTKTVANVTFDFASEGDATGQSPKTRQTDPVPAEYANVTANVTLTRTSTAPTSLPGSVTLNSPTVRVLDPTGKEVLVVSEEGVPTAITVPAVAGAWTLRFEGAGTVRATVQVLAHA